VVVAWLTIQVADVVLDNFGAPAWIFRVLMFLLAIGFPFAIIFAWAFELTPDGLKRENEVDRTASIAPQTGKKLDRVIIAVLLAALGYFVYDKFVVATDRSASQPVPALQAGPKGSSEPAAKAAADPAAEAAPEPAVPAVSDRSIAVLPFVNMSADPAQEYFSDGVTEEIINALVRIPGLSVAARTSVFALKGQKRDVRELGRELGVAQVLEGSIRTDGDQVRITAQLIKVDDGFHLWSETFDRKLENIFAIQEGIANAIAEVLTQQSSPQPTQTAGRSTNVENYDAYLRGRALLRNRGDAELAEARVLFLQVTGADPQFAPGWAALAMTANVLDDNVNAELWARKALALDPDNVDALNALGAVYRNTWRWAEAQETFERALAIDPLSSQLLEDFAEFLAATGQVEKQLTFAARGYDVDPYLPPLADVYFEALMSAGDLARATEVIDRARSQSELQYLDISRLMVFFETGDIDGARSLIASLKLNEEVRLAVLAALGNPADTAALANLRRLFNADAALYLSYPDSELAELVLLYIGDTDHVINEYLRTFTQSRWASFEMFFTPLFAGFRRHERFGELLELAGLPAYWDSIGWPGYCQRSDAGAIVCQ
jgi:TolB-like protein